MCVCVRLCANVHVRACCPCGCHNNAKADDSLLYPWTGDACARYGVLQAEDEAGPAWEQLRQEHAHALQYIDQHFGLPNLNLAEVRMRVWVRG